ncbi:MAG: ABC transporter permease [Micrococcales bacterium]|nr:ABC transporter permease [Micrococcales bacterium]MCL2666340.1 ABC transporter permease [Micrococcales bacterium]
MITTPTPGQTAPSAVRLTYLVARREIRAQLRSKSFWVSVVLLLVMVLGGILGSSFLSEHVGRPPAVAVVPELAEAVSHAGLETVQVADRASAERLLRDRTVSAAVVVPVPQDGVGQAGALVLGLDSAPTQIADALALRPPVRTLEPPRADDLAVLWVTMAFGIVFLVTMTMFSMPIAQNTVTEKQTRVVEILLSAVPTRALFAGKVAGNCVLALAEIVALVVAAVVGLVATGRNSLLDQLTASIAWFVGFFVVGFVLIAVMFAASAALVSRQEDLSAVLQPMVWVVMVPYFLVIYLRENTTVLTVLSYVPFSAPLAMPVRLFSGGVSIVEPLLSGLLLIVTTVLVVALGTRVYERSVLRTGTRVRLTEALR